MTAKEAVKSTGKNAGTHARSVGPGLARDKSEPGTNKPSRSVSERSATLTATPPTPLTEVSGHSEAAPNLSIVNKPESLAARLDDILKTGGPSSSRMYAAGLGSNPQATGPGVSLPAPKPRVSTLLFRVSCMLDFGRSVCNQSPYLYREIIDRLNLALDTQPQNAGDPGKPCVTVAPPGSPGEMVPFSTKWIAHVLRLIREPDFDPREEIDRVLRYDLVGILAHMPFELRERAASLYTKGYRVFGKVPCIPASNDADWWEATTVIKGYPRPMTCPEPAGEGCVFTLAWQDGGAWEFEFDPLDELLDLGGWSSQSEISLLRLYLERSGKQVAARLALRIPGDLENKSLSDLRTFLGDVGGMDVAEFLCHARAFRAGVTCSRKLLHCLAVEHYRQRSPSRWDGWPSIIRNALERHGLETDRKTLLGKLGCLNTADFKKNSKPPLNFSWRFTPPVNGINFDKYFGEALKSAKQIDLDKRGLSDRSPDVLAKPAMDKNQRNARYRRRANIAKVTMAELAERKKHERAQIAAEAKPALEDKKQSAQAVVTREQNSRVEAAGRK